MENLSAEESAKKLLLHFTEIQHNDLGYWVEVKSGLFYDIYYRIPISNIDKVRVLKQSSSSMEKISELCIVVNEDLPMHDLVLTKFLNLSFDEEDTLRTGRHLNVVGESLLEKLELLELRKTRKFKVKCILCEKIEEISKGEIIYIGGLVDENNLDVIEYLELIQKYKSSNVCKFRIKDNYQYQHIWVIADETEKELNKMIYKYMLLKEEEEWLNNIANEYNHEIEKIIEKLEWINTNKIEVKNEFKELTGSIGIEKWI